MTEPKVDYRSGEGWTYRQQFEEWAKPKYFPHTKTCFMADGTYASHKVQAAWQLWCELVPMHRAMFAPPASAGNGSRENHIAIREAHNIAASDSYFEARPLVDSPNARRIFDAGFVRGFDALRESAGEA